MSKQTWVTPYLDKWKELCGGNLAVGPAIKALAPVRKELGDPEALLRFEWYLRSTPAQYASAVRFAQIHGQYASDYKSPADPSKGIRPAVQGRVV